MTRFQRLSLAILIPCGTLVLQWLMWDLINPLAWFLFFAATFISAVIAGLTGGILATITSVALVWYFFLPPRFSFWPHTGNQIFAAFVFSFTSILFSIFSERMRRLTEKRTSEDVLRKSQAQLKTFIEHAPISIAMLDREMNYVATSGRWINEYGRGYSDLAGRNHYDVHPDVPDEWKHLHQQGLAGITVKNDEDMWTQKDGSPHWLRWAVVPWTDENGRVGGIIISAEDITDRKRSEEAQRIAAVAFQSHDAMVVTDANEVILQVNNAFTTVTGYSVDEAIGKTPAFLKSGRHDAAFYRNMWEAISHEGRWEGEVWNRRKDGGIYPEWLSISSVRDTTGKVTHYLGVFSDISDPKEAERKILDLAFYDPLTGLPNRRLLLDRLDHALATGERNAQFGAILLLDLDHFKTLNDTRGHDLGDELLIEVARRLRHTLRDTDSAARLGGDEFVVLLEGLGEEQYVAANVAETIAEKLRAAIGEPAILKGETYQVTSSIGVTLFRSQDETVKVLLKQADIALYQAKDSGRNAIRFYNATMQAAVDERANIEAGLRRALSEGHFALYYQPQVTADSRMFGAEALLRWRPPGQAMISPSVFIPVAESSGLIVSIGRWVLETACRQVADWANNPASRDLVLAVNISARQFKQLDFVDQVHAALKRSGADPTRLKLEVTESLVIHDVEKVISTMQELKRLGVGFSIDDFGTGYSSLAYLKRLPIDQLKIDQGFVHDIVDDAEDLAIVKAIISLGSSLGLQVIAEGVENEIQRDILAAHVCHAYQGYLFGRPVPALDLEGDLPDCLESRAGAAV